MSPAAAELRSEHLEFKQMSPLGPPQQASAQPITNEIFQETAHEDGQLMELDWAAELRSQPGMERVMTAGALLSPDSKMPADHLFTALLRHGLVGDLTCLYDPQQQALHTLVALGRDVCGHGGLVHGGMSATVCDETLGALAYMLKRNEQLPPGPIFTARLEVDYKKPLPAPCTVCCTARLLSVDGRKLWSSVELADRPGGTVYASGKALFVTPRQPAAATADGRTAEALAATAPA